MNFPFGMNAIQFGALVVIVVGVIGLVMSNWGKVTAFFARFKTTGGTIITQTQPATDDDTLDFQAHGRLHKRFTRLKCPEGLAACSVQLQHFYHAEGHK